MNYRTTICIIALSIFVTGCTGNNIREEAIENARQAIERLHKRHVQAALEEDVETFLATVTDDFRLMPPNDPGAQGKEEMRSWFNSTFGAYRIAALVFPATELSIDQDWAFRHYTYDWTLEPKAGGESIRDRGNGLYVYHREDDGSWKVAYDIWTSSESASTNE